MLPWPMKIAALTFIGALFAGAMKRRARHWNDAPTYHRAKFAELALALVATAFVVLWIIIM